MSHIRKSLKGENAMFRFSIYIKRITNFIEPPHEWVVFIVGYIKMGWHNIYSMSNDTTYNSPRPAYLPFKRNKQYFTML